MMFLLRLSWQKSSVDKLIGNVILPMGSFLGRISSYLDSDYHCHCHFFFFFDGIIAPVQACHGWECQSNLSVLESGKMRKSLQ